MVRPFTFSLLLFVSAPLLGQDATLTFERAVGLAVARNERSAIAQTAVEAAQARLEQARAFFFPSVDVNGSYRRDLAPGDSGSTLQTNATLTQTLFNARAFPLYRQAFLQRGATLLTAQETTRLLGFDAGIAYLTALSYEQVLIAAQHRRDFAQTNLDDVRARFEAGLVSSNDVTRAELELATAVRGVAQASGDVQTARINLATLINTPVDGPLAMPAALLDAADDPVDMDETTVRTAPRQRIDISAQVLEVEALRAFAQEPRARFLPSVLFQAQTRNINDGPVSNRNNDGFFGVSFAWPVFDGGIRVQQTAERNALVRGAELELKARLRDIERELRGAAVRLSTEQASLREALAATAAARRNAEETNALYREGLASALELADANQRMFEAEVAEVTARYRMALAYLALREASGETVIER